VGQPPEEATLEVETTTVVKGPDGELLEERHGSSLGHQEWREPSRLCTNKRLEISH
jgi:hypothetical protein